MADFGLAGFPVRAEGVDRMAHHRTILEMLPEAFSTVWISDHFQFGNRQTAEGWTVLAYTYRGHYYRVDGAYCEPRPDPPIPIMVGTNGPKALDVTARLADWWHWDGPWEPTYREAYETLKASCEAIGRPFEEITLTAGLDVNLPEDPGTFEPTYTHSNYPGQVFHNLGPTADDVIREIETLVDVGVSHFQIGVDDAGTLLRFVEEVVPRVRHAPIAEPTLA